MGKRSTKSTLAVYLYIPNIVGYMRIIMNCVAFGYCSSDKKLFAVLYLISFVCDGLDGWLARKFNQVSTFGAVLDMVTDRVSTACLLVILSQFYRPGLAFLSLLALDIASHWLQMYSTFLSGKVSHKDVKDSSNWLFKAYYGHRFFMAYCCVGSEVLYIILFLLVKKQPESVIEVLTNAIKQGSLFSFLALLALFGWAIKQAVNIIQLLRYKKMEEEVASMLQVGLACIAEAPQERPRMWEVVKIIEEIRAEKSPLVRTWTTLETHETLSVTVSCITHLDLSLF